MIYSVSRRVLVIKTFEVKLICYIAFAIIFFALFAYKDIYYTTEKGGEYDTLHMYADHPTYVNYFRFFRENILIFLVIRINYLGPFFIIWLTSDNLIAAFIFNVICFLLSIKLIARTHYFEMNVYTILLILNPITFFSLFSVNKEVVSLLAVSLFIASLLNYRKSYIILSLLIAFLARKELALFMSILYVTFRYIPQWNRYKIYIYIMFIFMISVGSYYINNNFSAISGYATEAENVVENDGSGGTILLLNDLQNKYGYYLVVIPKVFLNLYGSVLSRTKQLVSFSDVYNDIVVWGQSFLYLYVLPASLYISWKRNNYLLNKLLFSFIISCILFSYIPVVQNRYFYSSYILLIALISIKKINLSKILIE